MRAAIYYMTEAQFREGSMGVKWCREKNFLPNPADLTKTHVHLRNIEAKDLEDVFYQQQGEVWSPNGEARDLIRGKGLRHTSMSVGDVVVDLDTKETFVVDRFGFVSLGQV